MDPPAEEGEEASSTRQQRRRRPRPGAEPSAELAAADSLPDRGRSRRAVAPLVSAMPSALGEKLHLQDQQLLSAPLRVDEADLFPMDQEPMYITQPPVEDRRSKIRQALTLDSVPDHVLFFSF